MNPLSHNDIIARRSIAPEINKCHENRWYRF